MDFNNIEQFQTPTAQQEFRQKCGFQVPDGVQRYQIVPLGKVLHANATRTSFSIEDATGKVTPLVVALNVEQPRFPQGSQIVKFTDGTGAFFPAEGTNAKYYDANKNEYPMVSLSNVQQVVAGHAATDAKGECSHFTLK